MFCLGLNGSSEENIHWRSLIENVLFPRVKSRIFATKQLEAHVKELTNLDKLYKIFERC